MFRRSSLVLTPLLALTLALSACGSGTSHPNANVETTIPGTTFTVIAKDISFPKKAFTAHAGKVTIGYVNGGQVRHTLLVEDNKTQKTVSGWSLIHVDGFGDTAQQTVTLAAGTYTLYCNIPGHRAAGMQATLTVQ